MADNFDLLESALSAIAVRPSGFGLLGKGDGSGVIVADVSNRLLFYQPGGGLPPARARLRDNIDIRPYIGNHPELEVVRVTLGFPPENPTVLYITGFDQGEGLTSLGGITPGEQLTAAQKYSTVGDLINFRLAPNNPADTEVYINPGWYIDSSGNPAFWAGGSTGDVTTLLTTAIAALSSGEHQMAAVYIDAATGEPGIVTNTAEAGGVNDKQLFDTTTIEEMTHASGEVLNGAVHLYDGQTSITEADIYRASDPRIVFNKTGSGGGDTLPVVDTTAIVKGSADATKLLRFEVDGFTTATTRVLTPPNYDGTIATLAGTETLTNKTLTSPAINTPVISGGTIDNTPIGTTTRALGYFSALRLYLGGFAAILTHAFTADRTVTLPGDANVTLVGLATTQTLTNKKFDDGLTINDSGSSTGDVIIEGDTNTTLFVTDASADSIGMGTATPDVDALLEMSSTTKGLLIPRMTTAQRNAIATPPTWLKIRNTTTGLPEVYNGTRWVGDGIFPLLCDTYIGYSTAEFIYNDYSAASFIAISSPNAQFAALYNGTFWEPHYYESSAIYSEPTSALSGAATTTSGSPIVTGIDAATVLYLTAGMTVTGTNIAGGSTISSISGATQITLSANATGSGATTLTCTLAVSKMYDVFLYYESTVFNAVHFQLVAWTNDTTRATTLTTQNNIVVKNGDTTRRYIGTLRTDASSLFNSTVLKRSTWNMYNRIPRALLVYETANNWGYTSTTIRQANGSTANQVEVVAGIGGISTISLDVKGFGSATTTAIGAGEDVTNAFTATPGNIGMNINVGWGTAQLVKTVPVGYHFYAWNERGAGGNTFQGDNGNPGFFQAGMDGWFEC